MKYKCHVRVKNELGLHTRPATVIVKMLQNCESNVSFTYEKETVDAKSILSILMLAVRKNSRITIKAEGNDAKDIITELAEAFDSEFE